MAIACALCAAMIAIGSYIKIPSFIVPFTLQFFFVNLSVLLLDGKYKIITIVLYISMGLLGLPVFAGGGGLFYIIKPTFGYILGFLLFSVFTYIAMNKRKQTYLSMLTISIINIILMYFCGVTYLYAATNILTNGGMTITAALLHGVVVFLPTDIISAALSSYAAYRINKIVNKK